MVIDWFTVGAQALNFLVLVWLLKRFLYRPVLDAIDAREARIARQISDAQTVRTQAQAASDALQRKHDSFDGERAALLAQAKEDAQTERERLLDAAQQAADALTAKHRAALEDETARTQRRLVERTRREVYAIARRALADLASASVDARIADVFVERLQALDDDAKASLAPSLRAPSASAVVRSAFELAPAQRSAIRRAVDGAFGAGVALTFETAPELIGGIELEAGGHKLAWSIGQYVTSMEAALDAAVPA